MFRFLESRTFEAVWIFSLEDDYLKRLQGPNSHPRPLGPLVFELTGQEIGGVIVPLPRAREMVMTLNASGYYLFFGKERLSEASQRTLTLDPGRYQVRVRGPYYQQAIFEIQVPLAAPHVEQLVPAGAYPFPPTERYDPDADPDPCGSAVSTATSGETRLRGGLFNPDGSGLAGAAVEISPLSNRYTVGEDGQWVLWFAPGNDTITGLHQVDFTLPDGTIIIVPSVCIVKGRETSLPATALRGHVLQNGLGVPDALISVSTFSQNVSTRKDGSWWYYFLPDQADQNVNVRATLPDGQTSLTAVQIISRSTIRVPSFKF